MTSPQLFDALEPPTWHVILHALERPEATTRLVSVQFRQRNRRTLWFHADVDRYSPEGSIFQALTCLANKCEALQAPITQGWFEAQAKSCFLEWVAPF